MMFQWKQNRIEGLIAQSLYERLTPKEQRELDTALSANVALKAEYDVLRKLVESVPAAQPASIPNLVPLLNSRLDGAPRRNSGYRIAYAATAILFCVSAGFSWYAYRNVDPSVTVVASKPGTSGTLVSQSLAEAEGLLAKQDISGAYEILRKALSYQPGDARAGEAQLLAADCAFKLKRYSEAYDAYQTLFDEYGASLTDGAGKRTQAIHTRDLLAEAKKVDFASLQAVDVAKRDRANTFAALESVASTYASYQGTEQYALGDLVATEMAAAVAAESGVDISTPAGTLAALTRAHERCTSPIAIALLDIKIGDAYRDALNDPASAKLHYERAAENPVLASLATKALDRLK